MTLVAILQAVEQGKLDLDREVRPVPSPMGRYVLVAGFDDEARHERPEAALTRVVHRALPPATGPGSGAVPQRLLCALARAHAVLGTGRPAHCQEDVVLCRCGAWTARKPEAGLRRGPLSRRSCPASSGSWTMRRASAGPRCAKSCLRCIRQSSRCMTSFSAECLPWPRSGKRAPVPCSRC